jgi:hypothetical protein
MVHKAPNAREAPKPQRSQRLRRVLSRPRHKVVIRPLKGLIRPLKCPPRSPYLKACSNATHGGLYTWPEQVIARPTAALCTADRRLIIIVGQHTLTLASLKPMAQSTSETTSRAVSGRSSAVGVSATITPKVGEPGAEHGSGCSSVPACSSA